MTTVLQFSGGKDSLACLHLLRHRWHEIVVAWVNTGAAFPETVEYMRDIRKLVPNFLEINGTQNIAQMGYPADVVPTFRTYTGLACSGDDKRMFQQRFDCCRHAIWTPLHNAMKLLGATTVIRGQKNSDRLRSPIQDGSVVDGVRYEFPLQGWTNDDVFAYLQEHKISLPPGYSHGNHSLDCWNCTAYLSDSAGRIQYMKAYHPEKHKHVVGVLHDLSDAIASESAPLHKILEKNHA